MCIAEFMVKKKKQKTKLHHYLNALIKYIFLSTKGMGITGPQKLNAL